MECIHQIRLINTLLYVTYKLFCFFFAAKANQNVQDDTNCKSPSGTLQVKECSDNAGDTFIFCSLHFVYCNSTTNITLY